MERLEEIQVRKSALKSTIESQLKGIKPLERELEELEAEETKIEKAKKTNKEKEGV